MVHALWIEWRKETLQTVALLAAVGAIEQFEPDAHIEFDDLFSPAAPVRQDPDERRALIARLAAG